MILAAALVALTVLGPAHGDPAQRTEDAFEAGQYDIAAAAAAEAYEAHGDPVYLYMQAQSERLGDHCQQAIAHYEQFLRIVPEGAAAQASRENIAECEQRLASASPPVEEATPTQEARPSTEIPAEPASPRTPVDRRQDRRWYRDPWGGALVGAGVVALGVGAGLFGQARADERAADRATEVVSYGERIDRAYTLSRIGVPVMITGGVLVAAGVVRWIVVGSRGSARTRTRAAARFHGLTLRF
ncbi:MAG: hypothetical protein K0V04_23590 [Deltaproteobacteria bacterium]|nr:hypothetical protein [Deltaproteobacteria bacterium]